MTDMDSITFAGQVSATNRRPFVLMEVRRGGRLVYESRFLPSVVTALGLRAIQSAIEAERDAGLVAFIESTAKGEGAKGAQMAAVMLDGLREHRQQFDAESGSMRPLGPDDPSRVGDRP